MSQTNPKISVIIPMYNVEKYLNFCISSVMGQTFKDFELILVDDCSTDKTVEVAKNFDDPRIKILRNEKNFGCPGPVRNVGIENASGEYIYFMDSDDAILPNTLEVLYKTIELYKSDVVASRGWYVAENIELANFSDFPCETDAKESVGTVAEDFKTRIMQEFVMQGTHSSPCIILTRKKIFDEANIRFLDQVSEDTVFIFDLLCATSKITKISFPFYFYRQHPESVSHNINRLYKNVSSIPILHKYIEKKLSHVDDFYFVSEVLDSLTDTLINVYIHPYFMQDKEFALREIERALKNILGENSMFAVSLIRGYLRGINAVKELKTR